jgi:hypothetical protein
MRHLSVLTLVLLAASPAWAFVVWEASGGTDGAGYLTQPSEPPAIITSGDTCPALNPPDACLSYYGEADLPGPPGGLITLHASSRVHRMNATGNGFVQHAYGGARVTIIGLAFSSVASPVSQVYFNFRLHGTRVETTTNGEVNVVATGLAYLSADAQHYLQCVADVCEPIKVNVTSGWNPYAEGGTSFLLDLRTDATIAAPMGAQFDAEAFADYKDTLEVISLEPKDANGDPVPGVSLVIKDAQGQTTYTFPNAPQTTTSTLAGGTTTLPGGTTTTTLPGGTTTTTLPGGVGCGEIDGIAFIDCACTAGLPTACAGAALPASLTKGLAQACDAADEGNANTSKKGKRLLTKASKKLAKLGKIIGKPKVAKKVPASCVVAAQAFFGQLQSGVDMLRAAR